MKTKSFSFVLAALLTLVATSRAAAQSAPIRIDVDATGAQHNYLHATLLIPVQPGPLTLAYPRWIPGEHGPTGPINDLVDLKFSANGNPLPWQRDPEDMFAFHLDVPPGADTLEVSLGFLLPSAGAFSAGVSSTDKLLDLAWNQVLLFPRLPGAMQTSWSATLHLPSDWQFGTALPVARTSNDRIEFGAVPLETLVDSPVIAGEYFRTVDLSPGSTPPHFLHMVADSASDLEIKPADTTNFMRLVAEANALFGAHHYTSYHFLLTISDHVTHFGLEHHESSDDRVAGNFLTDEDIRRLGGSLLPHEMVHSWNGKYRRPAGLVITNYSQPMEDDLLWVYEGLTTYCGDVLAARSGLWTNADFMDETALAAAILDRQEGRLWRPLSDTTAAAQLLYEAPGEGAGHRRRVDFYGEGVLIWLEADTIMRRQSNGRLSLDDFCRKFHGGQSGPPAVVPYTLDDITATLNSLVPWDWPGFFQKRVYEINPRAPVGGIENAGWKLAYTNHITAGLKSRESAHKYTDVNFSLGFSLDSEGTISDVLPGSPADLAGIGPSMKLIAVNTRAWSPSILRDAISFSATNQAPIALLVENSDYFKTFSVDYHGGEQYPCLDRDSSKPDILTDILRPLTPASPPSAR
jgi:predicted metalloprotease with PDZ domain